MNAYIVTGGTLQERSEKMKSLLQDGSVSPHDLITISPEGSSIGVDEIRGISSRLSIHPVAGKKHAVVINDAHAMTIEAQNASLKTLEEPPGDAIIILETSQPDALLPTILSRCQLVNLGNAAAATAEEILQCINTVTSLTQASIGSQLQVIDGIAKTRDDALSFVNLAIAAFEKDLKKTGRNATLLRALLIARTQLLGNINPKLAIDAVFLYNVF